MYASLSRVIHSLILCTATRFLLNALLPTNVGLDIIYKYFFSSATNLTSTLFLIFAMVLPNTELFNNFKKSFSQLFFAFMRIFVL